jgi:3',5'-cyclic AMP phosphodiesterase CpdA
MGSVDVRLAVVSDIHGNLTALEAVIADIERRGVDRVVHGGDLALAGCQPVEVVDRVRELGWLGIVGNTDELLWPAILICAQARRRPVVTDCPSATRGRLTRSPAPADLRRLASRQQRRRRR